jgi:hypothetical protein
MSRFYKRKLCGLMSAISEPIADLKTVALWKPVSYEPIVYVCESTYKHSWRTKSGGGWLWLTAAWSIVSQSILVRPGVSGLHKTDEPSKHVIISSAAHLLSYTVEIWCIWQLCLIMNTLGDNGEDNHQSCSCLHMNMIHTIWLLVRKSLV